MKKMRILFFLLLIVLSTFADSSELEQFLHAQTAFHEIKKIEGNSFFTETFQIMVWQPLDHSDTTKGFFLQRVFVADKGKTNPVLFITEGYGADYAKSPRYINELSPMFGSNQIFAEHRYFGESWPDSLNWEFLTVANAAADHHKIVQIFNKYYQSKWINTGISKGGQTAIYHRSLYPNDVDISVAYVCPLNFGVEDGRHEPFIAGIPGTSAQRKQIEQFQIQVLKNRQVILPKLVEFSKQNNFTYKISFDEVIDYCVLEYPFALWQWGRYIDEIPSANADPDELFAHLMKVSGPSYFAIEGMESIKSFFVQAAAELGYYGYDIKPFKKYLSIKTSKNYLEKIFLPDGLKLKYNKKTAKEVKRFIKKTDSEILFIYGEYDPWSASGFNIPDKSNLVKIVKPKGSHSTRIKNLPDFQKEIVRKKLENWLGGPIHLN